MERVSIIIPCYNPTAWLAEAVASARAQTYPDVEVILVDDGTATEEGKAALRAAAKEADACVIQPNRGLPAARNAGMRAATGDYFLPLDCDDALEPGCAAECLAGLKEHGEAAFAYPDYRVFGERKYTERLREYNLYSLLEANTLIYAALIRRRDWETAGGYDESMRLGYEDWDFWLRLAECGRFGAHVGKPLFRYRKHGRSLLDTAREHHAELVSAIRAHHPALFSEEGRARVKKRWAPAACAVGAAPGEQTIEDWDTAASRSPAEIVKLSRAEAFVLPAPAGADAHAMEWAALAVWGGHDCARLPDGSLAVSRAAMERAESLDTLRPETPKGAGEPLPGFELLHRHLSNAGLLQWEAWAKHPARSAARLIPLRVKERVNRWAGRNVFDLSFYLQFQPESVMLAGDVVSPLPYLPRAAGARRRVAFLTPHLGAGGAETVLLEIAGALGRDEFEILVVAMQAHDARWLPRWRERADHIYDLGRLAQPERAAGAAYSILTNWKVRAVLAQNAPAAYSIIPQLKRDLPGVRTIDVVHAAGEGWDIVSAASEAARHLDIRVAISGAVRQRLLEAGTAETAVRLIRNGIDAARFAKPAGAAYAQDVKTILFAGRLDPVKRPLLLVDIARALVERRKVRDFRLVVAGDGSERPVLEKRVRNAGLESVFVFLGHVEDIAPVLAGAHVLLLPSRMEGIPMAALEAFAMGKPAIASHVGAVGELVSAENGYLIEVSPREAEEFAAAIDTLLDDGALAERLGRAGRQMVEAEYDARRAARAYRELFAGI